MRKIAVFTGTRAEYGLLYWLLKDIQVDNTLELQLLVSGTHLSPEFDLTYKIVEADGFDITEKVEMLMSSDTKVGTVKSIGVAIIGYSEALSRMQPDIVVILGDRYEALAIAQCALIMQIPILHIHGGEITEGAFDDSIRHSITKMSQFHCVTTTEHRMRVIQLGEQPNNVYNVGALGLDHIKRTSMLSIEELAESIAFDLSKPYFLVTYHPETLSTSSLEKNFQSLLDALDHFEDHQAIITYPNSDDGGRKLIRMIESYSTQRPKKILAVPSLGQKRYLSALKYSDAVIGNSSSGIIEAPSLATPTVNIGDRQKGRSCAQSVTHCGNSKKEIIQGIESALSSEKSDKYFSNPYGIGDTSSMIIKHLKKMPLNCKKTFYDLPSEV